jgi:2,4-dienoyl-CoA reductase-like NADH-dependent reductase (Old Yellow Enzyme family)
MTDQGLFSSLQLWPYLLKHRIVMPPLTRMRAGLPGNIPTTLNVEFYE